MGAGSMSPRTSRGERTAARLREAARDVFAGRGYAAARVEDVVAEAGVSHGTFYTYYENKAAVLDALIDQTEQALTAIGDEPLWDQPDAAAAIREVIARFAEVFSGYGDVLAAWLEASAYEQHFRTRLRQVREAYIDQVASHLAPALEHTPHDPTVAASALVAMVEGYATQGLAADDPEQRETTVNTLAAIWFGGLIRMVEG